MSKPFKPVEHATLKFNRFLGTSKALFFAALVMVLWIYTRLTDSKWHEYVVEAAAMVGFINLFTLQRSQNKDLKAIHLKLDELIATSESASNRLIKAEEAPEHVLDTMHEMYLDAAMAVKDDPSRLTISLDKADDVMKELHRDLLDLDQIDMRPPGENEPQSGK